MRSGPIRRPGNGARAAAALAASLLLGAVALAGCGGGSDSTAGTSAGAVATQSTTPAAATTGTASTPSTASTPTAPQAPPPDPKKAIPAAIDGVLASGVPALACERYATENYVSTTFGGREGCIQSTVPASAAHSVEVSKIKISGTTASATAVPSGGPSNGERISVRLVLAGSVWKVDSLHSNAPVGP